MKVIVVGRDSTCDFVVNDLKVSRKHMQIIIGDNGECSVVDIGSMNGTFVNGIRIAREVRLHHGDVVRIGNTVLPWESLAAQQPKPSKMWIVYVLTAVAVLLLAVIAGIVIHKQMTPKGSESTENTEAPANKEDNGDGTYIKYIEEKLDKTENEKANIEREKQQAVQDANTAAKKAEKEAIEKIGEAERARDSAREEKKAADKAKTAAEKAKQKAEKEKQAAEKAKQEAENRSKQNDRFYKSFSKLESKQYKQVAKDLGHVECNDPKAAILNDFTIANDSVTRERIIKAVESVLRTKSTSAKGKAQSKANGENPDNKPKN